MQKLLDYATPVATARYARGEKAAKNESGASRLHTPYAASHVVVLPEQN